MALHFTKSVHWKAYRQHICKNYFKLNVFIYNIFFFILTEFLNTGYNSVYWHHHHFNIQNHYLRKKNKFIFPTFKQLFSLMFTWKLNPYEQCINSVLVILLFSMLESWHTTVWPIWHIFLSEDYYEGTKINSAYRWKIKVKYFYAYTDK